MVTKRQQKNSCYVATQGNNEGVYCAHIRRCTEKKDDSVGVKTVHLSDSKLSFSTQ